MPAASWFSQVVTVSWSVIYSSTNSCRWRTSWQSFRQTFSTGLVHGA
jgi:hypothetical protein